MTVEEKLNLLKEAEEFYSDLSDAGEESYKLGRYKATGVSVVYNCLLDIKETVAPEDEWTEEFLAVAVPAIVKEEYITQAEEKFGIEWEEKEFYEWGFGLALAILQGDKEQIDNFRKLQGAYDELVETKLQNRTLADLIK